MEIIIGQEGDYVVADRYVGRRHAKLFRTNEGLFIEDLESVNGTYVNGKAVKKKRIGIADHVVLGKDYVLDIEQVLKQIPMSDREFAEAFQQLKSVYDTYNKDKVKIQSQGQGKMMLKRSVPMALPGILIAGASLLPGIGSMAAIIGAGLSAIAIAGGAYWGSKEMAKMPEKLLELDEQFKIDYSCPECKKPFGQQNSWGSLERQGKCPYCKRPFK